MKKFMDEEFLLRTKTASRLYHEFAEKMPIYDYHCHLSVREIAENKKYSSITEVWLGGDHYKWRALRANGVAEEYITGNSPDKDKFMKWAETMPQCIGNPLYHWTHLELKRYFGVETLLSPKTAEEIWEKCNELLSKEEFRARALIKGSNVKLIGTTDDPADDLRYHKELDADKSFSVRVVPTFRPDKCLHIEKDGFREWIAALETAVGRKLSSYSELERALGERMEYFHAQGCRLSDQSMDYLMYEDRSEAEANAAFVKALEGLKPSASELAAYKTRLMLFLGRYYARLGWTMQLHLGPMRNNNTRMFKRIGPDAGFDTMSDSLHTHNLAKYMDALDCTDELPKTILYCLNPSANEAIATMAGCFQEAGTPAKIQFGTGWWFNDQKNGMERQMTTLANMGLLSRFVGMNTDSRSFLSYTRHEYFRRVLCGLVGEWVENGEIPDDMELLGKLIQDICYNNAVRYFGIQE